MLDQSKIAELNKIAKQMVAPGKGILAADESMNTVGKRFSSINLENTEDNRRAFREMLLTIPGEGEFISGVILFDETIRQKTSDGRSFVEVLKSEGILPGIKVDQGLADFGTAGEKVTKGLDGLSDRLKEYVALGAKFCKWRSVITISDGKATSPDLSLGGEGKSSVLPTDENIRQNAKDLAAYALVCQENGLVPMVEPEVLIDGDHTIVQAEDASTRVLTALFEELKNAGVAPEGIILKTSMIISGKGAAKQSSPQEVAEATVRVFKKVLPEYLAGEAFLSGGQGDVQATENLNAIHQLGQLPWPVTFSYARALQDAATKTWKGLPENLAAAQKVFLHRAKMNSLASQGKYNSEMEKGFTFSDSATVTQD
ncbi:MAG: fructose-bisphosphate aldolase [Candidatus Doudnabacteria bacterium]|nr:fructose-bisphosphate aldolase [Candidatus Doudnabacteria bacterium]